MRHNKIALLVAVVLFVACTQLENKGSVDAKTIFAKNCVLCHGADGKKGFGGAGDLTQSLMAHEDVLNIIRNGKNENPGKIMMPYKDLLNEKEIEAVAKYVEALRE